MPSWLYDKCKNISAEAEDKARAYQLRLTKPEGALGILEQIAIKFSGWQNCKDPMLEKVAIVVFAADHGVTSEGVSAYPQAVTVEMIKNFINGGAAISVLANDFGAKLKIVNVGTASSCDDIQGVIQRPIGPGTENFLSQHAMSQNQCVQALDVGREMIEEISSNGTQLFIGGEMGIGNTSSATALACKFLNTSAENLTGLGTGIDANARSHKVDIINAALTAHRELADPTEVLACFGGFEIAALVGAYITAAQKGIPSVVDGFIATAAALVACEINDGVKPWLLFSHQSAEQGHKLLLDYLRAKPLLQFDMRLGEGSGAALCVPIIRSAISLHNKMATFEEAAVSNKIT